MYAAVVSSPAATFPGGGSHGRQAMLSGREAL